MAEAPNLSQVDCEELLERLTLYASNKLVKLYWRGAHAKQGGTPPGGVEATDLAADAIFDLINGVRKWDKAQYPTLTQFLMGVVDSKVNHLAESLENRRSRSLHENRSPTGSGLAYPQSGQSDDPANIVADEEHAYLFRSAIVAAIKDDPLALQLVECFDADVTKPAAIARQLDVEISDINNAQKRLRRAVENVVRVLDRGEK